MYAMCSFGVNSVVHDDEAEHIDQYVRLIGGCRVVEHSVVWCGSLVFEARNGRAFSDNEVRLKNLVEQAKTYHGIG